MSEENHSGNWWNTVPGVLGGLAALITAITGLIVVLSPKKPIPKPTSSESTSSESTSPESTSPESTSPKPPYAITTNNNAQWIGKNSAGQDIWNWTVYLTADPKIMSKIDCVKYTLHDDFYPNHINEICKPTNNFALSASGWGEFNIKIKVIFKDDSTQDLNHWLKIYR